MVEASAARVAAAAAEAEDDGRRLTAAATERGLASNAEDVTNAWSAARASVPSAAEGVTDETSLAAAATERRLASAVEANEALEDSRSACAVIPDESESSSSDEEPDTSS